MNKHVSSWVAEIEKLCKPKQVIWCNGSEEEKNTLTEQAVQSGELIKLNQQKMPGCYLHRSSPNDVARTEHRTFICTPTQEEAGPTSNWISPPEAYQQLRQVFSGSMQDRTMYVIPFLMGPAGSPFSKVGIQITDSIYVVLNMRIMTRMGNIALDHLKDSNDYTKCLHSKGTLDEEKRYICHFPQDNTVWSVNSAYGGNALLGKKCLALRIASYLGQKEGWLAEHMLIMGVEDPEGKTTYIAAAFPSACGKTNLAMLVPPASQKGWKIWTVGDDIAWMRIGKDGRLWAINPEAGFFGVAPGTNKSSNPNAIKMLEKNCYFTNVALKPDGTVWWEGMEEPPAEAIDWKGRPWNKSKNEPAAHPNSRFTVPITQCPSIQKSKWESAEGVPISAILFGARRTKLIPLVYEAFNWQHGTFLGATLSSETTAAAAGAVGVLRRDPMAIIPFCGYNMADYFRHWLSIGKKMSIPPKIYRVNWFRKDENGKFIWPGYGENLRVLQWIVSRCNGTGKAEESPIGNLPAQGAISTDGLNINQSSFKSLFDIDKDGWLNAVKGQVEFFKKFGNRLPKELWDEHHSLAERCRK